MSKKPCFLRLFWIFFKLGAILAHQTSCCMFSGSWRIFWHPWDPWGRINSGDTRVLRFVFDFFACQRPLADFFHSSQIEARCHFYWFDMNKSDNITFYSHNGWVFKVIQAVSVVIWMDSEQISPVCSKFKSKCPLTSMASKTARPKKLKMINVTCENFIPLCFI